MHTLSKLEYSIHYAQLPCYSISYASNLLLFQNKNQQIPSKNETLSHLTTIFLFLLEQGDLYFNTINQVNVYVHFYFPINI